MRREIAGAVNLSLLLWHLASILTRPAAGWCLPNITRIDASETDHAHTEQHEAPQPASIHKRVSFQIHGIACGRDAPCCSRKVFVTQGAIIRLVAFACTGRWQTPSTEPPPLHSQLDIGRSCSLQRVDAPNLKGCVPPLQVSMMDLRLRAWTQDWNAARMGAIWVSWPTWNGGPSMWS